ncbi:MAG: hypothetical protein J6K88_02495 [Oscillospiraceae bacterium]|nr:hypothetical protein [Oscillospiraceae bacterium]
MANRRMFHKDIVTTDRFLRMSPSCQALYFQLCMNADDEGFVGGAYKITRSMRARKSDLYHLKDMEYIQLFGSGVAYINEWYVQNRIPRDRIKPTFFRTEKMLLCVDDCKKLDEEAGLLD